MSHVDPYPTRVDYLRYDVMQKINDNVNCVARFAVKNPNSDVEDYIRQVTEKIEDLAEGRVGPHEYVQIVMLLRSLAHFVRVKPDEEESNKPYALSITNRIIEIVQGDTEMNKSTLSAMIFRRVDEAVRWGAISGGGGSDERVTEVVEECVDKIMTDAFGGKTPAEIQAAEFVPEFYDMDPETEDLLDNGTLVVDGMRVLIENDNYRATVSEKSLQTTVASAKKGNRWCIVSSARIVREADDQYLSFIGTYDDGTKRKWYISAREAWFVKKNTIPRADGIYSIESEEIQFTGIPDQVVSALRSISVGSWDNYMVRVGGDGFESVSEYLWRVERLESEDETDLNRFITLRNEDGQYIATATNQALIKAYVKRYIEPVNFGKYTVQTPETNVPKPLLDYLGINDELVVWDEEGTEVFKGTREEIRKWADSPTGRRGKYLGYEVAREGLMGGTSLKDFMLGRME
jgi:hypothetical protein